MREDRRPARDLDRRQRQAGWWLWGAVCLASVAAILLFRLLVPPARSPRELISTGLACAGVCAWALGHGAALLLFVWEARWAEWAFPVRGRWIRHFLSGLVVAGAVGFTLVGTALALRLAR